MPIYDTFIRLNAKFRTIHKHLEHFMSSISCSAREISCRKPLSSVERTRTMPCIKRILEPQPARHRSTGDIIGILGQHRRLWSCLRWLAVPYAYLHSKYFHLRLLPPRLCLIQRCGAVATRTGSTSRNLTVRCI